MGNQLAGDQDYDDSESNSSQQDVPTDHRPIPVQPDAASARNVIARKQLMSHVRLVPLSGSPKAGLSSSLPNLPFERSNVRCCFNEC